MAENAIKGIDLNGLKNALQELSIDNIEIVGFKISIRIGKNIYLGRKNIYIGKENNLKKIRKRIIVSRIFPDKPLDPGVYGYEVKDGGRLIIILQPLAELYSGSALL